MQSEQERNTPLGVISRHSLHQHEQQTQQQVAEGNAVREEERKADEQWRELQEGQRRRNEAAEEEAWNARRAAGITPRPRPHEASSSSATEPANTLRGDDEPDAAGWTPRQQRALEAAMRAHPASAHAGKTERWMAIAAAVPGHDAREVGR